MYTRCPHCQTTYRLSSDDLRSADGEVECGHCGEQFNAIKTLTESPASPLPIPDLSPDEAQDEAPGAAEEAGDDEGQPDGADQPVDSEEHADSGDRAEADARDEAIGDPEEPADQDGSHEEPADTPAEEKRDEAADETDDTHDDDSQDEGARVPEESASHQEAIAADGEENRNETAAEEDDLTNPDSRDEDTADDVEDPAHDDGHEESSEDPGEEQLDDATDATDATDDADDADAISSTMDSADEFRDDNVDLAEEDPDAAPASEAQVAVDASESETDPALSGEEQDGEAAGFVDEESDTVDLGEYDWQQTTVVQPEQAPMVAVSMEEGDAEVAGNDASEVLPTELNAATSGGGIRWIRWLVPVVLLLLALGWVHESRDKLARNAYLRPVLVWAYGLAGVRVEPLGDIRRFAILDSNASEDLGSGLTVSVTYRNLADYPQRYPILRVTLEDRWGGSVAVRFFDPAEYLAGFVAGRSMGGGESATGEAVMASAGTTAVGFNVDLCTRTATGDTRCASDP